MNASSTNLRTARATVGRGDGARSDDSRDPESAGQWVLKRLVEILGGQALGTKGSG